MLDGSRSDDDNSHRSITESEKVLPCRQDDQVFNSWDTLMDHIRLQHSKTCYECFEIPGTDSYFSDHIAQEHRFQCHKCGLKFAEESNLEDHIFEGHEFTCEKCNAIFGNNLHFEYHKQKYHESSSKTQAVGVNVKCEDEGSSKAAIKKTEIIQKENMRTN